MADIYYKNGYEEVVAQAGTHTGTFKVFVNFIPVADITQVDQPLLKTIKNVNAFRFVYPFPHGLGGILKRDSKHCQTNIYDF